MESSSCSSSFSLAKVFVLFHFFFCISVFFLRLGWCLEVLLLFVRRRVEEVVPAVLAGLLLVADRLWKMSSAVSSPSSQESGTAMSSVSHDREESSYVVSTLRSHGSPVGYANHPGCHPSSSCPLPADPTAPAWRCRLAGASPVWVPGSH